LIKNPHTLFCHIFFRTLACLVLISYSSISFAWGKDAHTAIGILAVNQLQPDALAELQSFMPLTPQAMTQACNWPDEYRGTDDGDWSKPLHYVNIPRGIETYEEARDCPENPERLGHSEQPARLCVTEAIKHYANRLLDKHASNDERKQSFAWLCHLVGDLHQPLHAGFEDDRGGNDFDVNFHGKKMNLHRFWDSELLYQHAGSWQYLVGQTGSFPMIQASSNWDFDMVNDWTNESHQLAEHKVYRTKRNKKVKKSYQQQSWELIQQQIRVAAKRLAVIVNKELDNAD
jgi:hypothetical protein